MKVKCINPPSSNIQKLTLNKIYDVIKNEDGYYRIKNDYDEEEFFFKFRFKTLKEDRKNKLEKLKNYENKMYRRKS